MFTTAFLSAALLLPAVEQLGDRRFAKREVAHLLLEKAGPVAWPALASADTAPRP